MKLNFTKKLSTSILGLFALITTSFAQISTGDIVILGVNADASDIVNFPLLNEITIGTLADIPSGETIYISDYAYDGAALVTSGPVTSEGVITFTTTSVIPKGTVIKLTIDGNHVISGGLSTYGTVTASGWDIDPDTDGTGDAISGGGDNWFIFTGSIANPDFIYGFANWSTSAHGATNWMVSGTPSSTTSYLPSSLVNGLTANLQSTSTNSFDNNVYSGTKSATKYNLLTALATPGNWTKSESTVQDINPGGAILSGSNPILTVLPTEIIFSATLTTLYTCEGTASPSQNFTVSGTGINDSISINAPNGFEISTSEQSGYSSHLKLVPNSGNVSDTKVYVRIKSDATGTINGDISLISYWAANKSFEVSGVVNTIPSAPTFSPAFVCDSGTVTFNEDTRLAKPSSPFTLYVSPTASDEYYEGTTTPKITSTTNFYISKKINGCESPRTKVTAVVNNTPNADNLTGNSRCGEGVITLGILGRNSGSGPQYYWFADSLGSSSLATGTSYEPTVTNTTKFYVEATENGCTSARKAIIATVKSLPDAPFQNELKGCAEDSFTLESVMPSRLDNTKGCRGCDVIKWYDSNSNYLETGDSYTTPLLPVGTSVIYFSKAVSTINGCESEMVTNTVSVYEIPANPNVTEKVLCVADSVTFDASSYPVRKAKVNCRGCDEDVMWYDNNYNYITTADIFTTPFLTENTQYFVKVMDSYTGCSTDFYPAFVSILNISDSVNLENGILTAIYGTKGTSYQWLNCEGGSSVIIPDENSNTFTPTVTGDYSVEISKGDCKVTSKCVTVNVVATGLTNENSSQFSLYPNPAKDKFTLIFAEGIERNISIIDLNGVEVLKQIINSKENLISVADLSQGVYVVKVSSDNATYTKQVVIVK